MSNIVGLVRAILTPSVGVLLHFKWSMYSMQGLALMKARIVSFAVQYKQWQCRC